MIAATPQHSLRLRLLGTHGSSTSYGVRDLLYRSDVPFEWIELTSDEEARELAQVNDLHVISLLVRIYESTMALPGHGRSIANFTIWKPAFPECSPPAMFAMAP